MGPRLDAFSDGALAFCFDQLNELTGSSPTSSDDAIRQALVFDARADAPPLLARPDDCQTCFACELYCQADALYVDPSVFERVKVNADTVRASGLLGVYRRDSGWDEWADDPRYANQHWRMEGVFLRAGARWHEMVQEAQLAQLAQPKPRPET